MATYECSYDAGTRWIGLANATATLSYNGSPLKLKPYEYPTGFHFNGNTVFWCDGPISEMPWVGRAEFVLCDSWGGNKYHLADIDVDRGRYRVASDFIGVIAGQTWTNLKGKTVAIGKVETPTHTSEPILCGAYDASYYSSITITTAYLARVITWTNPSLTFSQNEYELTLTRGGSAVDSWEGSITYRLRMDGIDIGAFNGTTKTITLTDDQLEILHTFDLVAVSTVDGQTASQIGTTVNHTPHSVHKTVKYWTGSEWVESYAQVWDGTQWVEVETYYWDGTAWVPCSQT